MGRFDLVPSARTTCPGSQAGRDGPDAAGCGAGPEGLDKVMVSRTGGPSGGSVGSGGVSGRTPSPPEHPLQTAATTPTSSVRPLIRSRAGAQLL
ncbi:MAG: hypothetical protein JRI55_06585 [Deltaproteobacteria bacterium]|nr:hypothetical protein [Deltaproteobacteria bacterium]